VPRRAECGIAADNLLTVPGTWRPSAIGFAVRSRPLSTRLATVLLNPASRLGRLGRAWLRHQQRRSTWSRSATGARGVGEGWHPYAQRRGHGRGGPVDHGALGLRHPVGLHPERRIAASDGPRAPGWGGQRLLNLIQTHREPWSARPGGVPSRVGDSCWLGALGTLGAWTGTPLGEWPPRSEGPWLWPAWCRSPAHSQETDKS
jgi:hypothetical protein